MKELFDGVVHFNQKEFEEHEELFKQLGKAQNPHTLFVGCSDSRVVPNLITKTLPGELFVVRNIANIVPAYRESGEYLATTSAIEYALIVLDVKNIVICGHSNCGGCKALFMEPGDLAAVPHVKKWLELAACVKPQVVKMLGGVDNPAKQEWLAEQLNVVHQISHLMTYPNVKAKVKSGELNVYGWHYIIETGEVYNYNFETKEFELIK
jgi:carbonic anhydrase